MAKSRTYETKTNVCKKDERGSHLMTLAKSVNRALQLSRPHKK